MISLWACELTENKKVEGFPCPISNNRSLAALTFGEPFFHNLVHRNSYKLLALTDLHPINWEKFLHRRATVIKRYWYTCVCVCIYIYMHTCIYTHVYAYVERIYFRLHSPKLWGGLLWLNSFTFIFFTQRGEPNLFIYFFKSWWCLFSAQSKSESMW